VMAGEAATKEMMDYPGADDGVRGMQFIEQVIASGKSAVKWLDF
jgi:hypothetical protein